MDPVIPGDKLAVLEQYAPGEGTYVLKGGIHACVLGFSSIQDYSIKVDPLKPLPILRSGDHVIGAVMEIRHPIAILRIAGNLSLKRRIPECLGRIHVFNLGMGRIRMDQALGINDILKAMVLDPESLELSLRSPELGTIKAYCQACRNPLERWGSRLRCNRCHRIYKRKISSDYGKGVIWNW